MIAFLFKCEGLSAIDENGVTPKKDKKEESKGEPTLSIDEKKRTSAALEERKDSEIKRKKVRFFTSNCR